MMNMKPMVLPRGVCSSVSDLTNCAWNGLCRSTKKKYFGFLPIQIDGWNVNPENPELKFIIQYL